MDYGRFIRLQENSDDMYNTLMKFDNIDDIMATLGHTLDYWAAAHDVTAETLEDRLVALAEISKMAHECMGLPDYPYGAYKNE